MDPSCGKCVSSDCSYNPGYTDPSCPEHGIAAKAAAQSAFKAEAAELNTRTLRKLVAASTRKRFVPAFSRHPLVDFSNEPCTAAKLIERCNGSILYRAKQGRRRAQLFRVSLGEEYSRPETKLSGARALVYKHFKARVKIVFRHIWNEHFEGEYDVWAVW